MQEESPPFIVWRPDYSVGVEILDLQHRQVIDVINAIYRMRSVSYSKEESDLHFLKLQFFTESHFHYEEVVMRFANYPNYEEHRLTHHAMIEKTARICSKFRTDVNVDTDELFQLLKNWWLGHICGEDRGYREHVDKLKL